MSNKARVRALYVLALLNTVFWVLGRVWYAYNPEDQHWSEGPIAGTIFSPIIYSLYILAVKARRDE